MATATKRIRRSRLTTRQETPRDFLKERLTPLRRGQVVKLIVEATRTHGTKTRTEQTLLMLAPGAMFGMIPETVIVMLEGKGCRVIFPASGKGAGELARAGLPPKLAKALVEKLTEIYGEQ